MIPAADLQLRKLSLRNPLHLLAVGFGSGFIPKAPGTFGTLAAVPLMVGLSWTCSELIYSGLLLVGFVLGIWCCQVASNDMGVHDHRGIVWDEFIGFGITLLFIPLSPISIVCAFFLFRFFDIAKPWPICCLDHLVRGGLGIMLDDLLAGFFAWLLLSPICAIYL